MSAAIKYKVVATEGKRLPTWSPSRFIDSMSAAFGDLPIEIGPTHLQILRGMAAAFDGRERESIQNLIDEIGESNVVRIWAEY